MLLQPLLALQGLTFADLDRRDHRHRGAGGACSICASFAGAISNASRWWWAIPNVDLGIKVCIDRPEAVGADRLVNAVAAHERYKGALIVVDFGTATTFDIVGANGDYEGGVIAPGANLSARGAAPGRRDAAARGRRRAPRP